MAVGNVAVKHAGDEWKQVHDALSKLAKERALADLEEGHWLLRAFRCAVHLHLGFGNFFEYVERLLGYKPRSTHEKLRVAEALEGLPVLSQALAAGQLTWSAVRELTRVAAGETERSWLEAARGKTLRQVEDLVAGRRPGDEPTAPPSPLAVRHVLRFEVTGETFVLFREAMAELRRRSAMADDDSALLSLARLVLGGPDDGGRASYQVALNICERCGAAEQLGNGQRITVGADVVEMAHCDAQHIGRLAAPPANENTASAVCAHVGPPSVERNNDVAATVAPKSSAPARAAQTIPPALRRAALRRDHQQCRVPGCRNATFLDLHHLTARAEGGAHSIDNLVTVCGAHHRALHHGELIADGCANDVQFLHADGSRYGLVPEPARTDTWTKVFGALRNLEYREKDIRPVLDELRRERELKAAEPGVLLRAALRRLGDPRGNR